MNFCGRVRWARLFAVALTLMCSLLAARLTEQAAAADAAVEAASRRAVMAEAQAEALQGRVTSLEKDVRDLRRPVSMAEFDGVDTTLFVSGPPVPRIDGSVTAVRADVEPAVVLLSVGSDDGVERGFHFSVYRGSLFVAKVVVEHVLSDSARCRVLFTVTGEELRSGDSAATRLQ